MKKSLALISEIREQAHILGSEYVSDVHVALMCFTTAAEFWQPISPMSGLYREPYEELPKVCTWHSEMRYLEPST